MRIDYLLLNDGIKLYSKEINEIRALDDIDSFRKQLEFMEKKFKTTANPNRQFDFDERLDTLLNAACRLVKNYLRFLEISAINESKKITIIDSIMGSGKTQFVLNEIIKKVLVNTPAEIQNLYELGLIDEKKLAKFSVIKNRFLCVVPYLDEVERYKKEIINAEIFEPDNKKGKGSKREHLKKLIKEEKNIITTHALIKMIDEECVELLNSLNYTLIIDEELNVVDVFDDISRKDLRDLHNNGYVTKDELGFLQWNPRDDDIEFRYDDIKRLCNFNCLMEYTTDNDNDIVIWNFPYKFFNIFRKTYICTYQWNGSLQKAYFDLHNIRYQHKAIKDNKLVDYDRELETERRKQIKPLVKIYSGEANRIGDLPTLSKQGRKSHPLSKSWYIKNMREYEKDIIAENEAKEKGKIFDSTNLIKTLRNNLYNIFHNIYYGNANSKMWTCYEGFNDKFKKALQSDGCKKGFVPCNAKGTNKYIDRYNLAYLIDFCLNPIIKNFFLSKGISIDEDLYSLSSLLQWLFRSRIRNGEEINLYIPSERMRHLLIRWLNNKV